MKGLITTILIMFVIIIFIWLFKMEYETVIKSWKLWLIMVSIFLAGRYSTEDLDEES